MVDTSWRGTTASEREQDRRSRLISAALRLLDDDGSAGVTVRAVTREAAVSPRLFYESFPDRDALVYALWRELADDMTRIVGTALLDGPMERQAATSRALLAFARWLQESPRRTSFMLRDTLADPVLRVHARRLVPTIVATTLPPREEASDPHSHDLLVTGLSGAIVNIALEWSEDRLDLSAEDLVSAVTRFAAGATEHTLDSIE